MHAHDSQLLSSTLQLLLSETLATAKKIGDHEARLTALERQQSPTGSESWLTSSAKRMLGVDLKILKQGVEIFATVIRFAIWFALHVVPVLTLIGGLAWRLIGRLMGL